MFVRKFHVTHQKIYKGRGAEFSEGRVHSVFMADNSVVVWGGGEFEGASPFSEKDIFVTVVTDDS